MAHHRPAASVFCQIKVKPQMESLNNMFSPGKNLKNLLFDYCHEVIPLIILVKCLYVSKKFFYVML